MTHFSALGGESLKLTNECREISWKEDRLNCLEFTYKVKIELEVLKFINLQGLASELPNVFTDPTMSDEVPYSYRIRTTMSGDPHGTYHVC